MGERFNLRYFPNLAELMTFLNGLDDQHVVVHIGEATMGGHHNLYVITDSGGLNGMWIWNALAKFLRREKCDE